LALNDKLEIDYKVFLSAMLVANPTALTHNVETVEKVPKEPKGSWSAKLGFSQLID